MDGDVDVDTGVHLSASFSVLFWLWVWDGMGWDRMGWDGIGWNGMGNLDIIQVSWSISYLILISSERTDGWTDERINMHVSLIQS